MEQYAALSDLCRSLEISKFHVEQWISRKIFVPRDEVARGQRRLFDHTDAMRLVILTWLSESGVSAGAVGKHISPFGFFGHSAEETYLVFWTGLADTASSNLKVFLPGQIYSDTVRKSQFPMWLSDRDRNTVLLISLDQVDLQVRQAFAGLREQGKVIELPPPRYASLADKVAALYCVTS